MLHLRRRHERLGNDQAVDHRPELHLDRRDQHADHRAAEHFRIEADLVGGTHDADVVGRIGADIDDVGVGRRQRAHHRRVVRRARRIVLVVDQPEAVLLELLAGALGRALGELGVGGEDRDRLRLRLLRRRHLEEALGEGVHAFLPDRDHREVFRIVVLAVDADGGVADHHLVVLDDRRHRRRHEVGAVGPDQQIDFVDRDQLGVDARHVRRGALVVVDRRPRPGDQAARPWR